MLNIILAVFGAQPPAQISGEGYYTYSTNRLGLTWTNNDASAQIRLYRDGTLASTQAAGTTSFETADIEPWDAWTGTSFKNGLESLDARVNFNL